MSPGIGEWTASALNISRQMTGEFRNSQKPKANFLIDPRPNGIVSGAMLRLCPSIGISPAQFEGAKHGTTNVVVSKISDRARI
jgi:hypothetical protein